MACPVSFRSIGLPTDKAHTRTDLKLHRLRFEQGLCRCGGVGGGLEHLQGRDPGVGGPRER